MDSQMVKLAGLIKVVLAAKTTPPIPAQVAPRAKARQFGSGLVDAHGLAGDFVFPQGDPGPADPGILQPGTTKMVKSASATIRK